MKWVQANKERDETRGCFFSVGEVRVSFSDESENNNKTSFSSSIRQHDTDSHTVVLVGVALF